MGVVKRLEWLAKNLFAVMMAALCWRPGRRARARQRLEGGHKRVLLVRIDNRVGEALLTTPLIDRLAAAGHEVHVLTHPKVRRVLEGHPHVTKLWDYRPRRDGAARRCAPSASTWWSTAATGTSSPSPRRWWRAWPGGPSVVLGPANFPSGWLMDVPRGGAAGHPLGGRRSAPTSPRRSARPITPVRLSFRPTAPFEVVPPPYAVVNPGGRLGYRRVPAGALRRRRHRAARARA